MRIRRSFAAGLALAALLIAAVGCACAAVRTQSDAKPAIDAALARYVDSVRNSQPDATVACFTEDGEMLQPGGDVLHGRAAIRAFLEPLAARYEVESATMEADSLDVVGELAVQIGRYAERAGERGGPASDYRGRFAFVWRRERDGAWRIARALVQVWL